MNQYEINETTMAIVACGENLSMVYEEDQTFSVPQNANKIMEDSCAYFGSSLEGRRKGTEALIGINYKPPVIVEEFREIIFFPTSSLRNKENTWICLNHIEKYYKNEDKMVILFKNGTKIELNLSYGILDNQVLRSTRLESALRGRKKEKKPTNTMNSMV